MRTNGGDRMIEPEPNECKYCYNEVEDDNLARVCDDCLCDKLASEEGVIE